MKWVFRSRSIGTTLSLSEALDNAAYPTAGVKYPESKTKVRCCNVCPITLWTVEQYAGTSG